MKRQVVFCCILFLALNACNDEKYSFSEGVVTGADMRYCACCGGYFIEIGDKTYRFFNQELPEGSFDFDSVNNFPINVVVTWKLKAESCMGDEILIAKISIKD